MGCDYVVAKTYDPKKKISIHAPIVGCDVSSLEVAENFGKFQSTHPSWGATKVSYFIVLVIFISIHAPIVGCDEGYAVLERDSYTDFNPRTHRGVRLLNTNRSYILNLISIHAPIVGCDLKF